MFYNASNETVETGGAVTDYICFGNGPRNMILLPGVGDGLKTVKGLAGPFSVMYKMYAKDFRVYVFSRRRDLPEGFTTRDMADDLAAAMEKIGIRSADVVGVSQGGMIAEYLAIRHPERVNKLVLAVTTARSNPTLAESVDKWIGMSKNKDYRGIMIDTAEKSYTGKYLEKNRMLYKMLGSVGKPKDFTRFVIQCRSCVEHDAYGELDQIQCPTLVIGAALDKIATGAASREIAERIPGSELYIYEEYSHGVYEQAKDFNDRVIAYLLK